MLSDRSYCDFLILAPLPEEVDALLEAMDTHGWEQRPGRESNPSLAAEFRLVREYIIKDAGVGFFRRKAVVICLNRQGVLNASVDTARALELYEPGFVISFGIAGSLDDDAPIGSVIFCTQLIYYEPAKDKSEGSESRTESRMGDVEIY